MYIAVDKVFYKEEEAVFRIKPWEIQQQCGVICEELRTNATKPLMLTEHYNLLISKAKLLEFNIPNFFSESFMSSQIEGVMVRNKLYQAAKAKVTLLRSWVTNETVIIVNSEYVGAGAYEQNAKGLMVDIFKGACMSESKQFLLNQYCQVAPLLARREAAERNLNNMLLITEEGYIASAIDAPVFAVRANRIITPPLGQVIRHDVLREKVIQLSRMLGYQVDDEAFLEKEDILACDELFICDSVRGLEWIMGLGTRRFLHKVSKKLLETLNAEFFE